MYKYAIYYSMKILIKNDYQFKKSKVLYSYLTNINPIYQLQNFQF